MAIDVSNLIAPTEEGVQASFRTASARQFCYYSCKKGTSTTVMKTALKSMLEKAWGKDVVETFTTKVLENSSDYHGISVEPVINVSYSGQFSDSGRFVIMASGVKSDIKGSLAKLFEDSSLDSSFDSDAPGGTRRYGAGNRKYFTNHGLKITWRNNLFPSYIKLSPAKLAALGTSQLAAFVAEFQDGLMAEPSLIGSLASFTGEYTWPDKCYKIEPGEGTALPTDAEDDTVLVTINFVTGGEDHFVKLVLPVSYHENVPGVKGLFTPNVGVSFDVNSVTVSTRKLK